MKRKNENESIKKFTNKIICGDAIKTLKKIPDQSVELIFVDPPFNLKKKYSNSNDKKDENEYLEWCYEWIDECIRILKPNGTIMLHNIPKWLVYFANHLNEKKLFFRHWIAWDAMGSPLGNTLLASHYGILYYTKSDDDYKFFAQRIPHKRCRSCKEVLADYGGKKVSMHPFGTIVSDVWTDIHRIKHNNRRDAHPNQLPEPLLERLIQMTTEPGDLVLDPLIGAGTTALAAKRLGRKYVGIDNSKEYVQLTKDKLKEIKEGESDGYVYKYNKVGQTKTSINKNFAKIHTILNDDIVIDKKKLEDEKPSLYYEYKVEKSKK